MDVLLLSYGRAAMPVLVCLANYYLTTLSLWVGHWFSHLDGSPLRVFHLPGHHTFYPHSRAMRSRTFQYGSGTASSIHALLPWLLLQLLVEYAVLPLWLSVLCLLETTLIVVALNYLHTQFHLLSPRLEQSRWFVEARARHEQHHDHDVNFTVGDHFWDRRFRTYQRATGPRRLQPPPPVQRQPEPSLNPYGFSIPALAPLLLSPLDAGSRAESSTPEGGNDEHHQSRTDRRQV